MMRDDLGAASLLGNMKPNVIILTSGLSGSSVLTGLICRAGYWSGDLTHKKPQYDTFENERLIELNRQIQTDAGYNGNYLMEFSQKAIAQIEAYSCSADHRPYRELVEPCVALEEIALPIAA